MNPSLFLRASEVGEKPTHLETGEVPRKPDLLVPQFRPRLEFVLQGSACPRCSEGYINDGHDCDAISVPVRAFEIIAGDEGRVIDGHLERILGTDCDGFPLWSNPLLGKVRGDGPWREAWERAKVTRHAADTISEAQVDGPVYLVGPTVRGNFYGLSRHELRRPMELQMMQDAMVYNAGVEGSAFYGTRAVFEICPSLFGIEWRLGPEEIAHVTREEMGL